MARQRRESPEGFVVSVDPDDPGGPMEFEVPAGADAGKVLDVLRAIDRLYHAMSGDRLVVKSGGKDVASLTEADVEAALERAGAFDAGDESLPLPYVPPPPMAVCNRCGTAFNTRLTWGKCLRCGYYDSRPATLAEHPTTMIHIRPVREDLAVTTVCGVEIGEAGRTLAYASVADQPLPDGSGEDARCPECWKVWRSLRAGGYRPEFDRKR